MNIRVRFCIPTMLGLLALASPALSATEEDGDTQRASSRDISTAASDPASDTEVDDESAQPPPRGDFAFGANFRWSFIKIPDFALNAIFDIYQGHWDDRPKYAFGGEFFVRYLNQHDVIFGIEYQDLSTPAGIWLQRDDPITSANFTENSLSTISLLLEYEYFVRFLDDDSLHFYGGFGAGISLVSGDVRTFEQNPACLDPLESDDVDGLAALRRGEPCGTDPDNDDLVLGYDRSEELLFATTEDVPSVLPAFKLTAGLRYMIKEQGSVAIEGGLFNAAFYFGLEAGFLIPTRQRQGRTHAGGLQSAGD